MTDLWTDLLGCLDLHTMSEDRFEGGNQQLPYHRLFGGQLLAQFIQAAIRSCPGKTVKSLHVLFPREGQADEPVVYDVQRLHEGGTFASLTIVAHQTAGAIASASVSLHTAEEGRCQQAAFDLPPVPGPQDDVTIPLLPWTTRSATDLDARKPESPDYDLWMRTPPTDAALAPALAAYASDLNLIGTALRQLDGVSQQDAGQAFRSAVTSHTVWFHQPFRTDHWLLLRHNSPILARGRCYGRGDVLTEDGSLVASFAQEALLRFVR